MDLYQHCDFFYKSFSLKCVPFEIDYSHVEAKKTNSHIVTRRIKQYNCIMNTLLQFMFYAVVARQLNEAKTYFSKLSQQIFSDHLFLKYPGVFRLFRTFPFPANLVFRLRKVIELLTEKYRKTERSSVWISDTCRC